MDTQNQTETQTLTPPPVVSAVFGDNDHTTQEFADFFGVEKDRAYGLLRFLESKGLVTAQPARQTPGKRGKGQSCYRVNRNAVATVTNILETLFSK